MRIIIIIKNRDNFVGLKMLLSVATLVVVRLPQNRIEIELNNNQKYRK